MATNLSPGLFLQNKAEMLRKVVLSHLIRLPGREHQCFFYWSPWSFFACRHSWQHQQDDHNTANFRWPIIRIPHFFSLQKHDKENKFYKDAKSFRQHLKVSKHLNRSHILNKIKSQLLYMKYITSIMIIKIVLINNPLSIS